MKKNILLMVASVLMVAGNVSAQEAPKTKTVKIPLAADGKDQTIPLAAPGPGEILNIVVDVPVSKPHKAKTLTPTVVKGSNLHMRGGVGTSLFLLTKPTGVFVGGLVGEIGSGNSDWRLTSAFSVGRCQGNIDGHLAVSAGLAVMGNVAKGLRLGVGADLLYCSNVSDYHKERARERLVGGSFRIQKELSQHVVLTASMGVGGAVVPIPGGMETHLVFYTELGISYLWGK